MSNNTFAAIDFETANGSRSSVCSVGIVIVENGLIVDHIYELIRPNPNYYNSINISIHGLCSCDTDEAENFEGVWARIAPKVEGLTMVAHNSIFDEGCLKAAHEKFGMTYPKYNFLCTLRAARRAFPSLPNHKLSTVARHCGFDLEHHHHALADAEACAHIALKVKLL